MPSGQFRTGAADLKASPLPPAPPATCELVTGRTGGTGRTGETGRTGRTCGIILGLIIEYEPMTTRYWLLIIEHRVLIID